MRIEFSTSGVISCVIWAQILSMDISFEGLVHVAATKTEGSLVRLLGIPDAWSTFSEWPRQGLLGSSSRRSAVFSILEASSSYSLSQQNTMPLPSLSMLMTLMQPVFLSPSSNQWGVREGREACLYFLLSS